MDHQTRRLDEPGPPNGCPKCEGARIWGDIPAAGSVYFAITRTLSGQGLLGLNKTVRAYCQALVCVQCGYTELYTRRPQDLPAAS